MPAEKQSVSALALKEGAAPVVAGLQAARAALDVADTPETVQDVRAKLRVLREVCAAAMRDPNVAPEDVAHARRECEQLALEAAVKLGTMVPEEGAPGARKDLGSTSATVAEVAKRCGLSDGTLRNYRALALACRTKADEFMSIAREAINAGAAVPFGKLIALAKPEKPKDDPRPAPAAPKPTPTPPSVTTDPKVMAGAAFRSQEDRRQDDARAKFAKTREEFEREDEIKFCGPALAKIVEHLNAARTLYAAMEAHPLPAERMYGKTHTHPRDVQLQRLTEFFDDSVPAALAAAQEASSLDAEAIKTLRDQRDKAAKRRSG